MATRYDITIDQGSDISIPMAYKDAEGAPIDLSGWAARMQVRKTLASSEVADELTTENERISLEDNVATLVFPHAVTSAMAAGRYVYDLELENPDGEVTRVLEGALAIRQEVTR